MVVAFKFMQMDRSRELEKNSSETGLANSRLHSRRTGTGTGT